MISITFARIGSKVQTVDLPDNSLISDLKEKLKITNQSGSFYRRGRIVSLNEPLNDHDIVIFVVPIVGEATVHRNGKLWQIHKSDPDKHPSDFHAHNYENSETLDLYTGYLYQAHSSKKIAMLDRKDYHAILRDLSKRKDYKKRADAILAKIAWS